VAAIAAVAAKTGAPGGPSQDSPPLSNIQNFLQRPRRSLTQKGKFKMKKLFALTALAVAASASYASAGALDATAPVELRAGAQVNVETGYLTAAEKAEMSRGNMRG
jgi:hypothetical protein